MLLLFWLSLALLIYVYAGYPALAWLRAVVSPRPYHSEPIEPSVTVVVAAYNEEEKIALRIENLLALDYPREKLEIVIASDGSTDATVEIARRYQSAGVIVHAFPARRGKAAVLNNAVAVARGEIVVLADARQQFDVTAIRALVAGFADARVGAVSGELMMAANPSGAGFGKGVGCYWRYEKFIRRNESRANATVGATGAIYAIRRTLFERIPEDTILDDVVIPLRIVRSGYRVVFEPSARAYDVASATPHQEFVRKVRTIAGTFQLLVREPWLFDPERNPLWIETISHKALRLTTPLLQLGIFLANLALADAEPYRALLAAQVLFYVAAAAGHSRRWARRSTFVVTVPYTSSVLSWATVIGFVQFATRRQKATWERAAEVASLESQVARTPKRLGA